MKKRLLFFSVITLALCLSWTKSFSQEAAPFITKWNCDNQYVFIPTNPNFEYSYDIDWEGDGVYDEFGLTGNATHEYASGGDKTICIRGQFPTIFLSSGQYTKYLLEVKQWGDIEWESFVNSFASATNLQVTATDAPNLSKVSSLHKMFYGAVNLNTSFDHWDVSNITDMSSMFEGAAIYNQDLNSWDVSNVTNMSHMFYGAEAFDGDISDWDMGNVKDMSAMMRYAKSFNQDISKWDVSNVINMSAALYGTEEFTGDISDWDVSNVENMCLTLARTYKWNGDISKWDVSKVQTMQYMFWYAFSFNSDISDWDVSHVENMGGFMGRAESFTGDLSKWDVSRVQNMEFMFTNAKLLNCDLNDWKVGKVKNMTGMFSGAEQFDGNVADWDTRNVELMDNMFARAIAFNQDISKWETSKVKDFSSMFNGATSFKGDISSWKINNAFVMIDMFKDIEMEESVYNQLLINWANGEHLSEVKFNAGLSKYTSKEAKEAREKLTKDFKWEIKDGGYESAIGELAVASPLATIYPNPCSGQITIKTGEYENNIINIKIYNNNGQLVYSGMTKGKETTINTALTAGIYHVQLDNTYETIKSKLIVK